MNIIFIHYLNEIRQSGEFARCEAVLLINNCSPHIGDAFLAVLTREYVRVITFTPHTTHIFQVLDLALFGALKKCASRLSMLDEEQGPLHSPSGSITTSDRQWWRSTFGRFFDHRLQL
jgi:hypothetical protein